LLHGIAGHFHVNIFEIMFSKTLYCNIVSLL